MPPTPITARERLERFRVRQMRSALAPVVGAFGEYLAQSTRLRQEWARAVGSPNEVQGEDRERIVGYSSRICQTTTIGKSFSEATVKGVVGDGVYPQGLNSEAGEACALFCQWAIDDMGADLLRENDLFGLERLMVREYTRAGDLVAHQVRAPKGHPMGIALELIESDRIESPLRGAVSGRDTPDLIDGVERDELGRSVRYHVTRWERIGMRTSSRSLRSVAIESSVVGGPGFMFKCADRIGQARGLPYLVAALGRMSEVEEYDQAVAVAAKLAACLAVTTNTESPEAIRAMLETGMTDAARRSDTEGDTGGGETLRTLAGVGPGQILNMGVNEKITTLSSSQPGAGYEQFQMVNARKVAGVAGYPVEVAMGDFSAANFSVARMAVLLASATSEVLRDQLVRSILQPLYVWWLRNAIAQGILPDAVAGAGLAALRKVRWIGPARLVVDPEKELRAEILEIQSNLGTQRDALDRRGLTLDDTYAQRSSEKKREKELGIEPPPPPGSSSVPPEDPPAAQPEPSGDGSKQP